MVFDTIGVPNRHQLVTRDYRDRNNQAAAECRCVWEFSEDIQRRGQRKLVMIDKATDLNDLRVPPGDSLESLSGGRDG